MPTYNTTTKHGLRWLPGTNVGLDIDAGFQALAEDIDAVMAVADQGTTLPTSTPGSPGKAGRFFRLTTTGQLFFDYGTGWIDLMVRPTVVTALPTTNLYDGQIVHFQTATMAADGVLWVLRYRSASASAYKWEFVGGRGLSAFISNQENLPSAISTSYSDLTTPGPDITFPLIGDYDWDISVQSLYVSVPGSISTARTQILLRNPGDTNFWGLILNTLGDRVGNYQPLAGTGRTEIQDAGVVYRMKYLMNTSGNAAVVGFFNRFVRVTPVRVM